MHLIDAISNGKRKYTEKKQRFSGGKDKAFSKQEVSVMIAQAFETAVTCALSVDKKVTSPGKKRKVSFHTSKGDQTLDADDIHQQVEAPKIYRDEHKTENDFSSESSKGSES